LIREAVVPIDLIAPPVLRAVGVALVAVAALLTLTPFDPENVPIALGFAAVVFAIGAGLASLGGRRAVRWTLCFTVPGLALALVGLADAVAAVSAGTRLFGVVLLAIGTVLTVVGLIGGSASTRSTAAGLIGTAFLWLLASHNVAQFLDWLSRNFFDSRLALFAAALLAVSVAALVVTVSDRSAPSRGNAASSGDAPREPRSAIETTKDLVTILGVTGLVFAGLGFWYESVFVPSRRPPIVNLEVTAELGARFEESGANIAPVDVRFRAMNAGDTKTLILAGWYNVGVGALDTDDSMPFVERVSGMVPRALRGELIPNLTRSVLTSSEQVAVGLFPFHGSWLEPEDELREQLAILIRGTDMRTALVEFTVIMASADRMGSTVLTPATVTRFGGALGPYQAYGPSEPLAAYQWTVRPQRRFDALRRDAVTAVVQWRRDDSGAIFALLDILQGGVVWEPPLAPSPSVDTWLEKYRELHEKLQQEFGLSLTTTRLALALPERSLPPD